MAKVNIYKAFFDKNIMPLVVEKSKKQDPILFYLKLYTHLISTLDELQYIRGVNRLKIVSNLTREASHSGEGHYIKYINTIAREILSDRVKIQRMIIKDPTSDPLRSKTKILMAQNICMLRILKLSGVT